MGRWQFLLSVFGFPTLQLASAYNIANKYCRQVTSFDDTPIENRHPDPVRRQSYLPIRPARHPDTPCDLIAAHGKTMKKKSYVNIKDIHEIPFVALRSCWRDNDLHFETMSYQILASELWKRNLGELAVRLKGHGIFERVAHSAYGEVPVPVSVSHTNQGLAQGRGRGTSFARISSPPLSASYGTFTQSSTTTPRSYAPVPTTAYAGRDYDYSSRIYQFQQSVPVRHSDVASRQNSLRTEQRNYDEVHSETDWPDWLGFLALICFLLAAWNYFANPVVN
jgi:hypothetical protein